MKENIVITYKYNELPEETQQKIIENLYYINIDYDWWNDSVDYFKDQLKEYGIHAPDIRFSGFCSQGDGLSFTGSVELLTLLDKTELSKDYPNFIQLINDNEIDVSAYLYRVGRAQAVHERSVRFEVDLDVYFEEISEEMKALLFDLADSIEYKLEQWRLNICRDFYKQLSDEYDYLTSKEAIIETIEANEYQFTANGKIF